MSYVTDLLDKPPSLSTASKYTAMNGVLYLATGGLLVAWPEVTQAIFMDAPCDWSNARGHWLALSVRRSFRRSPNRRRFCG
jgi:hypothetical protein